MKRVLSSDPVTKSRTKFHVEEDGEFILEAEQDVTDIAQMTQEEYNSVDTSWKGDIHKVASIPMNIVAELQREGIWQDDDALNRWLNDPDNRKWRTKPGRL